MKKKLMPSDVYADPEDINSPKFISNSEIAKIVSDESRKKCQHPEFIMVFYPPPVTLGLVNLGLT